MAKKTSTPIDQDFQKFWDAYGLKRDRVAAKRAWRKLSKGDRRAALAGIARYRDDCEARGISRMYAQGYLNHRRWEDEQEDPTPTLPCMGGSDMHRSDTTAAKGNYSPPSHGKATGRRDSGNGDGSGSLPDMAIW